MASRPMMASESTTDSTASFRAIMTDTTTHLLCGPDPAILRPSDCPARSDPSVLDGRAAGQFRGLWHPRPSATIHSSAISADRSRDPVGPILSSAHANRCGTKL